jgi:tetratricopeptide (TPR) repeat protein/DNA-binding winged helix-turn-helix (wHTH) protein/TolB-like protein
MVTPAASPIAGYRFADFKLDLIRGCLTHEGQELKLRYQSFQLLCYFLEHPGVILAKDELAAAIWSDTSVTDNALVQCIADIRRELNDDPHEPRFIKTFPKIGYRFIAPVELDRDIAHASDRGEELSLPQLVSPSDRDEVILESKSSPATQPNLPASRFRGLWRFALPVFLTLLILVLHGDIASDRRLTGDAASSLVGAPILAVFPFGNETGLQDLDWFREGLSDMILTDLAHTGKWNVLSRERIHALLDDRAAPDRTSLKTMLEAARSVHACDFIVGTVSMSGQQIVIRVETRDSKDGHLVATDSASLNDHREIVADADLLSTDISRHLGFSSDASPPLGKVMTGNVDAYRYYSLGVEKAEQFQNSQAIDLFQKAIAYDPKFAMAYARIGYEYAAQEFKPQEARPYLEHALHLSEQLPPMNRLYIEAWSAMARSDSQAAISILQQITNQYPGEIEAYCQLSRILRDQARVEEAAALLRDAIQKNPNAKDLYNAFGVILILMERPQEAIGALKQYVALAPQNPNAHDSLGMSYELAGEYEASQSEYNKALQLDPEFEPSIAHLGDVYYQQGRYRDALDEYKHLIKIAAHSSDAKAVGYADLAVVYRAMGNLTEAQTAATEEMRSKKNAVWDSLVIAFDRNQKERSKLLQDALFTDMPNPERGSSPNLRMEFFYRGYIELQNGDSQDAIGHFKLALQHLQPSSGIDLHEDCLANAYLELGMIPNAIGEYQRILKLNPNYPLAYYHLGLSYQKIHDRADAASALQRFLQVNPSADQDSPPVLDAKRLLLEDSHNEKTNFTGSATST